MEHFLFFFKSLPEAFSSDYKVLDLFWQTLKFVFILPFIGLFLHSYMIFKTILCEVGEMEAND